MCQLYSTSSHSSAYQATDQSERQNGSGPVGDSPMSKFNQSEGLGEPEHTASGENHYHKQTPAADRLAAYLAAVDTVSLCNPIS